MQYDNVAVISLVLFLERTLIPFLFGLDQLHNEQNIRHCIIDLIDAFVFLCWIQDSGDVTQAA